MRALLILACAALVACSPQPQVNTGTMAELDGVFDFGSLEVVNNDGEVLQFDVYLAKNPDQRQRGLMFVRDMPATTGMLFVYDYDAEISMYMKNTYIPLDMVFARSDGTVSSVSTNTVPLTLDLVSSREPVRYVLELNAGTARRLAIGGRSRFVLQDW